MRGIRRPGAAALLSGLALGMASVTAQVLGQAQAPAPALELPRAVQLAAQSHPSIAAAQAGWAQQGSAVEAARGGYRPQVQAGIGAGRQADGRDGRKLVLSASQMLYDFGKVDSAVAKAEAGRRQQRARVLQQVDDIARDTALAAVEVSRHQRLKTQGEALITALRDLVRLTELRAAAGATSRADPITARTRVEGASAGLLNTESQLRQQRSRLQALVGAPLPERVEPPAEAWWAQALAVPAPVFADLPALQEAQAELDASRAQLTLARAQQMPTITLDAGANRWLGGVPSGQDSSTRTVMINLTSALYQGGSQAAQVDAAVHAVASSQSKLASTRLDWQERQRRHGDQAASLGEQLRVLSSRQQALQGTRSLYREQYLSLGTRSALDLLNIEQEISLAINDQINAQHDLWAARLQAMHAQAQLRPAFGLRHVQGMDLE